MAVDLPELLVPAVGEWRAWLREHDGDSSGVWLVLAKKGFAEPTSLTYPQALEEAACHGWVDGLIGRRDEATYRTRFTPRRPTSNWTATNIALAERLEAEGRMQPTGMAAVARAKASGRWRPGGSAQP